MMFEKIKRFYDLGLYDKEKVKDFVRKGKLTPAEYQEITGEEYSVFA